MSPVFDLGLLPFLRFRFKFWLAVIIVDDALLSHTIPSRLGVVIFSLALSPFVLVETDNINEDSALHIVLALRAHGNAVIGTVRQPLKIQDLLAPC